MSTSKILALILSTSLLGALTSCTTSRPSEDTLQQLCQPQAQLDNQSQYTLLSAGYEAIAKNDLSCAERLTTKARELDPKDPYAALNLGVIYQKQGKNQMARTQYDEAERLDGGTSDSKKAEASEATDERFVNRRPGEIAKRNLKTLPR